MFFFPCTHGIIIVQDIRKIKLKSPAFLRKGVFQMCKYASRCALCNRTVEVHAQQQDMNTVEIKIASDCPNLQPLVNRPIHLDAIYEIIASKEESLLYGLIKQYHRQIEDCTAYEIIKDSIGQSLGRYYELA